MSREIKFRAWDKKNKELFCCHKEDCLLSYKKNGSVVALWICEGKEVISELMQYTGLKDKNGKEIYEGDILKNGQADINKVYWDHDSWCMENYHAIALPLGQYYDYSEVIGNIYENPELLEEVKDV